MKCIIHKYAETIDEIEEFEKVIGLAEAMTAMEYHEKSLIKQGLKNGLESEFKLALKIKHEFGLQKAASMSQFSIEELKNEKIDENRFKSD